MWEVRCDCPTATVKVVKASKVKYGKTVSCGCYAASGERTREFPLIIASARVVWQKNYRKGDITFDDFMRLSQLDCHYCGAKPGNTFHEGRTRDKVRQKIEGGSFTYNGLDRVDNTIREHTLANVVPCCYPCNIAKRKRSTEEFLSHIERIYLHSVVTSTPCR